MQKILSKCAALLCCAALIGASFVLPAGAAPAQTVTLDVEGSQKTLLSEKVAFTRGESVYEILKAALDAAGLSYDMPERSYGRYVQAIGPDAGAADYSTWWSFYMNGSASMSGISSVAPAAGDEIGLAFVGAATLYPNVSVSPQRPVAGQKVTVLLTADITDYATNKTSAAPVTGATVLLGGITAKTGADGTAVLTAPSAAGNYTVKVEGADAGGVPDVVRRAIPLAVYASLPAGDDGSGCSLDTQNDIDVRTSSDVTAKLSVTRKDGVPTAAFSADKEIAVRGGEGDCFLSLSAGTTVTGPSSWTGGFLLPQVTGTDGFSPANAKVIKAVHVGSDAALTLSKPARLVIPGAHGCSVGYLDASGSFRRVAAVVPTDAAPSDAGAGFAGVYDDGYDLVVYTTVLGRFAAYQDLSAPGSSDASLKSAEDALKTKLAGDGSKWAAFALARAGAVPGSAATDALLSEIRANAGNFSLSTDLSSACIVLAACGYDPSGIAGVNLYEKLTGFGALDKTGLTGPAYALLALDARAAAVPSAAVWNRQKLVSAVLSYQKDDGSFSLSANLAGDADATAIALTALRPYQAQAAVESAVQKALGWLSAGQKADGGFSSTLGSSTLETSESCSMAVLALSSLGIDCKTDARFVKNGKSPLDALLSCRTSDGGFAHVAGNADDTIAEEEALMALAAYRRLTAGGTALYDFSDLAAGRQVPAGSSSSSVVSSPASSVKASSSRTVSTQTAAETSGPNPHTGGPLAVGLLALGAASALLTAGTRRKMKR